jgi:predicted Rossmann fold nucleotide-binding protein DprA/Smf involved in DNA uptake
MLPQRRCGLDFYPNRGVSRRWYDHINREVGKMKEIEKILKSVSDGLRLASQGILALAEKVNEAAATMGASNKTAPKRPAATEKTKAEKRQGKSRTAATRRAVVKKSSRDQAATAIDTVLDIIQRSPEPLDTAALREKTGFDSKKVSNILFKLKKRGKVKSLGKGLYTRV